MIFDTEKWQEIIKTLGQHKLRTALTALGVFWGIFMLTLLLGAGKGLENGVMQGFREIPNSVWIWSMGKTQIAYGGMPLGREIRLETDDLAAVLQGVPNIARIYPENSLGVWGGVPSYTAYKNKNGSFAVKGSHPGMTVIHQQEMIAGRYINELDGRERRKVAVIGKRVQEQLFEPGEDPIGKDIRIAGISFQVVGVFKSSAMDGGAMSQEEIINLPNETLRHAFNQAGWFGSFGIVPKPGVHAAVVEKDIIAFLKARKKISPDDTGVFGSFNLQTEFEKIEGLFTGIAVFSWVVAVGTILAGAIGVGNIMLIVVRERTREIGLRKALGATPVNIVSMIMQEALLITAVAGYTGLVAGVALLEAINQGINAMGGQVGMFANPEVDFATALSALLVLMLAGVFAALLPAAKAAAVNPIVALQDE